MKKLIYLFAPIVLVACGGGAEDQQKQVCDCKAVYDKMSNEAEGMESEGMEGMEASQKARDKYKEEYEKCDKFHAEVGDEKFHEMSEKCK